MLFLKVYILMTLISVTIAYLALFHLPRFYNKPTFYEDYKEGLIEDNIPLTFRTKYLSFITLFIVYNIAWFMMIPISIIIIFNNLTAG